MLPAINIIKTKKIYNIIKVFSSFSISFSLLLKNSLKSKSIAKKATTLANITTLC